MAGIEWGHGWEEGLISRFDVIWELKDKVAVNEDFYIYPWAMVEEVELDYGAYICTQPCGLEQSPCRQQHGQEQKDGLKYFWAQVTLL